MEVKNISKHIHCPNFIKNSDVGLIELIHLDKHKSLSSSDYKIIANLVLYVISDNCTVMVNDTMYKLTENNIFLIPSDANFLIETKKNVSLFFFQFNSIEYLCHNYSLEQLYDENLNKEEGISLKKLNGNDRIIDFFNFTRMVYEDGIRCRFFADSKIKEFLFLLGLYYEKEELYDFFYPILSSDLTFSQFVINNHQKVRTTKELAELANYSLSGFQKRFQKVFGQSAHSWMKKERLKLIFDDISHTSKTLKELSVIHGFSNASHFNDYCKSNLGFTPGYIRKKRININLNSY